MTKSNNQRVTLARVPQGIPQPDDFLVQDCAEPDCPAGGVLLAVQWLALDPFQRGLISQRHHFAEPVAVGQAMRGYGLGRVLASKHSDLTEGDWVTGSDFDWCQRLAVAADACSDLEKLPQQNDLPASLWLGALGMPGLTAWAGLTHLAKPQAGETLLVSAALGPVGSVVGQMARILGCRAVGIAGSDERCQQLLDDFGFDAAVNRNAPDLGGQIRQACGTGVDIYFDNVGGAVLEAAISCLALHARVILCGLMSQYNDEAPPPGPPLGAIIGTRSSMHGLVVYDYWQQMPAFRAQMGDWLRQGKVRWREDVSRGLETAPQAFCRLMRGQTQGRALVQVAD